MKPWNAWAAFLVAIIGAVSAQRSTDWKIPEVIEPTKRIYSHKNLSDVAGKTSAVNLYIPKNYYPGHFFVFIHIPKSGGGAFNYRTCPKHVSACGESCGCGNCGLPYYGKSGMSPPDLRSYQKGSCPILSYEINYTSFKSAFYSPKPARGRDIRMLTMIRDPISHVKALIGSKVLMHEAKYANGDRSERTLRCRNPIQHLNKSAGCSQLDLVSAQTKWLADGNIEIGKNLLRKMFAFGLSSFYAESMCLLQYQLGQFDEHKCNYRNLKKMNEQSNELMRGDEHDFLWDSEVLRKQLRKYTQKDAILYAEAKTIFFHRIRQLELTKKVRIFDPKNEETSSYYPFELKTNEVKTNEVIGKLHDASTTLRYAARLNLRQNNENLSHLHDTEFEHF